MSVETTLLQYVLYLGTGNGVTEVVMIDCRVTIREIKAIRLVLQKTFTEKEHTESLV